MKKWEEPQIFDLSLQETKGGPNYTAESDGPVIFDTTTGKWWQEHGKS